MAVTYRDIAEKLGVHVSTVSRAMANHPHVNEGLRQQIKAAAESLGYRPNPMVSALMASRRRRHDTQLCGILGLVDGCNVEANWRREALDESELGREVIARACKLGFAVDLIEVEGMSPRQVVRQLRGRNIEGVVIGRPPEVGTILQLPWANLAAATAGFIMREPRLHAALSHDAHSVRVVLKVARELGYKRVGLAISAETSRHLDHGWIGGYLVESQIGGAPGGLPLCLSPGGDRKHFLQWVQETRPEAIISNHIDFWELLETKGMRVPQDIGWVHLSDNCPKKGMAHIRHCRDRVAASAVDLVVAHLYRNERGLPETARTVLVEDEFVDGWSLPPRRAS